MIVFAEPWRIAKTTPPAPMAKMITALIAAPTLLTHLPTSRRMTPTTTTSQVRPTAMITCGHLPSGQSVHFFTNSWAKTPANSRNTAGIHIATLTQYQ